MNKWNEIIEGWKNLTFDVLTENERWVAEKRGKICSDCKRSKSNFCTLCGCYLPAKTRSFESNCPLGKWKKEDMSLLQ